MKQNYLFERHGDEDVRIKKTDLAEGPVEVGEKFVIALEPIDLETDYVVWALKGSTEIVCIGVFETKKEATKEMLNFRETIIESENILEHREYVNEYTDSYVELETSGVSLLMGIAGGK